MKLQGKVAVITGGASWLGRRTAEYFVRDKGAKVVVFDLNDDAGAALVAQLGEANALYQRVDVTDEAAVAAGVQAGVERFGRIDICVNCAGIPTPMKILDKEGRASNCGKFQRTVLVNLVGTFQVMAYCIAQMARNAPENGEERGVVVNVASGAAFDGQIGQTAYSASKAGVVGLSLPAARELAAIGVRVNSIAPGLFNTPMAQSLGPKVLESLKTMVEFPKRFGDMAEFASLCAYICENAYLNGECIRLDAATRLRAR
ncbi:MAG: SDR family NAD(P)-dependent oxidoreductase [Betaproteobacteria bacterium]|nr:SDR family NAD(P)-dependent oxidoreductase [Betaproteobacteria bacterium]